MGSLFGSFVLPLVIYLVTPKSDGFTRHHAAEGLNWQLTFLIWWLGCFVALAVFEPAGPGGVLLVLVIVATFFAGLGFSIAGMVGAARGRWWSYPIRIRFVAGPPLPADQV
jgi:uncharacterized Tic20 family protein